jgi:nucleoside-diphosphate-sugar epimerase
MKALVLGAGGFIGSHLVGRLKSEGYFVVGADIKEVDFAESPTPDEFHLMDLRILQNLELLVEKVDFDEIYQLAADMGGAGYIFSGENDANVMHNSSQINLNLLDALRRKAESSRTSHPTVFYSSSACIYPEGIQMSSEQVDLREELAYPANPDSEYGWEKLFSERLFFAYSRNYGIPVRVARFHNVYGPMGTYKGGKEKAPAAICRKVAQAESGGEIEIWGDGNQTRSFLYIDDCVEAVRRFVGQSEHQGPINIGSEEMISINDMAALAMTIAGKKLDLRHIDGPLGVRGRNSNNDLARKVLGWDYETSLHEGLKRTYEWISGKIKELPASK